MSGEFFPCSHAGCNHQAEWTVTFETGTMTVCTDCIPWCIQQVSFVHAQRLKVPK